MNHAVRYTAGQPSPDSRSGASGSSVSCPAAYETLGHHLSPYVAPGCSQIDLSINQLQGPHVANQDAAAGVSYNQKLRPCCCGLRPSFAVRHAL